MNEKEQMGLACELQAAPLAETQWVPKAEMCMSFLGNYVPAGKNVWNLFYQNNVPIKLPVNQSKS